MKRRTLIIAALLGLLAVLAAVWLLSPRPPRVEVIRLVEAPATRLLAINGKIRPQLSVDVKAPVGGTLLALPFDVGAQVTSGTVLARIDDAPEQAAMAQAQAGVAAQEAAVAQARRDLARYEALGEFVSKREVEEKRLAVTEGTRELQRRRASVTEASEQRDRRIIRAPFSGVILDRPVDPGQVVGADTVIYRLADLKRPEISAEIDEIYATDVTPGAKAMVKLPGMESELAATVTHVEPLVDPATGAREARLQFLEALPEAPAGLTVTINLIVDELPKALSIPRSAILQSGEQTIVRVVDEDGVVRDRAVRVVEWPAATVVVEAGLKAGERILATPTAASPGERVEIAN